MILVTPAATVEVTLTLTEQVVFAANVAMLRLTEREPGTATTLPPGQVVLAIGLAVMTQPFSGAPAVPSVVK
ncbi:hypothetical protein D3C73_1578030 [compost metagenome]